jgi:UDP-glucose 4-epimerase
VPTTLITGIAGSLAQRVAERLVADGEEIMGVDYRALPQLSGALSRVQLYRASYDKTAIEGVFRKQRIDRVLHLGRVGNLAASERLRFDLNVLGTQRLMNLCVQHGVSALVVLSTFHVYGADPRNHVPISEDDPMRAGGRFPELADAIQLDSMASAWVWRHPEVRTVVLRPTNVVGPGLQNTMSRALRLPWVPYILGFNPMMQFLHERDLADAIIAAARGDHRGIFNIAGPAVIPWRTALELCEARAVPIPASVARTWVAAVTGLPGYLVNFFQYPCVIGDDAFRAQFHWAPRIAIRETLVTTVAQARA